MPRPRLFSAMGSCWLVKLMIVELEVRVNPDDVEDGSVTVADHGDLAVKPEGE